MSRGDSDLPPWRWADRYDAMGLVAGLLLGAAVLLLGAPWWIAVMVACWAVNLLGFALRRRAGVASVTVWQRAAYHREQRRRSSP